MAFHMPTATVDQRPHPSATARREIRKIEFGTLVRIAIVIGVGFWAVHAVQTYGRPYIFLDARIYHGAVQWWASGGELYQYVRPGTTLGFTYPPFAALVMLPMIAFSPLIAGFVNLAVSLVVLTFLLAVIVNPIADRHGWPRWFVLGVAVPLAVATEPVRETFGYGQVNLLLAGLVVGDLLALRQRARAAVIPGGSAGATSRVRAWLYRAWHTGSFAGVGVGLATSIKLTPALFIAYFLLTRQWRAAVTAVGTAVAVTAATFLLAGHESVAYFGSVISDTGRVGAADATANQSLAGLLARAYDSPVTPRLMWLAFALLLLAVGLSRAVTAHNEGDELTAFILVALTANAICPISWSHHLVFVVPALAVLVDTALRRRRARRALHVGRFQSLAGLGHALVAVGLYALLVTSPMWRYEHPSFAGKSHYSDGLLGALGENSLALALILLVVLLPWRRGADPAFYTGPLPSQRHRGAIARLAGVRGS